MIENIMDVVAWKYGGKNPFRCGDTYESFEWYDTDTPKPTYDQLESDALEYKVYMQSIEYKRKRQAEYPKIDELTVALWEKVLEGNSQPADDLQTKRLEIKEKYPKEGEEV